MEYLIATYRALEIGADAPAGFKSNNTNASPMVQGLGEIKRKLEEFGHAPMELPTPNGYPDVYVAWTSAGTMVNQWNEAYNAITGGRRHVHLAEARKAIIASPPATAGAYVDALTKRLVNVTLDNDRRLAILHIVARRDGQPLRSTPRSTAPSRRWSAPSSPPPTTTSGKSRHTHGEDSAPSHLPAPGMPRPAQARPTNRFEAALRAEAVAVQEEQKADPRPVPRPDPRGRRSRTGRGRHPPAVLRRRRGHRDRARHQPVPDHPGLVRGHPDRHADPRVPLRRRRRAEPVRPDERRAAARASGPTCCCRRTARSRWTASSS